MDIGTLALQSKIGGVHTVDPCCIGSLKRSENSFKLYSSGFDCILATSDLNSLKTE